MGYDFKVAVLQSELATKRDLIDLKKDLIIWLGGLMALSIGVVAVLVKLL